MCLSPLLRTAVAAGAVATAATAAAQGLSCERLRAEVDAKIRSKGVSGFSLALVDAGSRLHGQAVGSCDKGAKQLVYIKGDSGAAAPAVPPPATAATPGPKAQQPGMITECADGRVLTTGSCKRP